MSSFFFLHFFGEGGGGGGEGRGGTDEAVWRELQRENDVYLI